MALPIFAALSVENNASRRASRLSFATPDLTARSVKRLGDAFYSPSHAKHNQPFKYEPVPISAREEESAEEHMEDFQNIVKQITALQVRLIAAHDQQLSSLRNEISRLRTNSALSHGVDKVSHHLSVSSAADRDLRKTADSMDVLPSPSAAAAPAPNHEHHSQLGKGGNSAMQPIETGGSVAKTLSVKLQQFNSRQVGDHGRKCVLQPSGRFVRYWEMLVMLCLVFTGIVSPVEIAFMEGSCQLSGLFLLNQLVNTIFLVDLVLQFFTMYEVRGPQGIRSVSDPLLIAKNYLSTWFAVDLASVIPFDTFGCIFDSEGLRKMKVARFVRLIRLLKLVRILRASRIVAHWQVNMAFPYTEQTLGTFVLVVIMGAHWMSCVWGIVGLESTAYSWIDALADGKPKGMYVKRDPVEKREPASLYLASLHFAFMTITSIGYGDIVPQQDAEYVVSVLCQLCGGLLWAYGISEVIGVVSNLNPGSTQFRRTMDDLNHMMRSRSLDHGLQVRLRSFFLQARELHDQERYRDLLSHMSPQLMSDVARVTNEQWIKRVWYLKPRGATPAHLAISDHFIAEIAVALQANVCSQGETLRSDATLRVLVRGIAKQTGKVLIAGAVWGEDFILENRSLRINKMTACLTFLEVQTLTRQAFYEVLNQSGTRQDCALMRRAVVKLAVIRGVQRLARAREKEEGAGYERVRTTRILVGARSTGS